jgi:hypothetical protein
MTISEEDYLRDSFWDEEEDKFNRNTKPMLDIFLSMYDELSLSFRNLVETLRSAQDILSIDRRQDRNHRRFSLLMARATVQMTDIVSDMHFG